MHGLTVKYGIFILIVLLSLMPMCICATEKSSVAMVTGINKALSLNHGGKALKGTVGMDLFEGDILKTGPGCQAIIMLGDGSEIKMNQNTEITIKAFNKEKKSIFITIGEIFGKFLPQETKVIFETPKGVAGIEGTEFTINVGENQAEVNVNEGVVSVGDNLKTRITKEESCTFAPGRIGTPRKAAFPQWCQNLKEYRVALEEATRTLKDRKTVNSLSPAELEQYLNERRKIAADLQDVQPPKALAAHKKNFEKINNDYISYLDTQVKASKNPSDRALLVDAERRWAGVSKEYRNFRTATRASINQWDTLKKGFRDAFIKRMPQGMNRPHGATPGNDGSPQDGRPNRINRPSDGPSNRTDGPPNRTDGPPNRTDGPPVQNRPVPPPGK